MNQVVSLVFLLDDHHVVQIITSEQEAREQVEHWRKGSMTGFRYGTDLIGRHWALLGPRVMGVVTNPIPEDELAKMGNLLPSAYRPANNQGRGNPGVWNPGVSGN